MALKPLEQRFGITQIIVTTMQAVSGAGYPGVPSMDILGNSFPILQRRREMDGRDPQSCWASSRPCGYAARRSISASCNRAPSRTATREQSASSSANRHAREILAAWAEFRPRARATNRSRSAHRVGAAGRPPQPRLDRHRGNGMAVNSRPPRPLRCARLEIYRLSHNTIRGAPDRHSQR